MADLENIGFSEANFELLLSIVKQQREQIASLEKKVKDLEGRLGQDSHNSSKPPSSDSFKKKIVNLGKKTGKRPGGQPGHQGSTLEMSDHVDGVTWHMPATSCQCGMEHWEEGAVTKRQVVDLPPTKIQVQEHRQVTYRCRRCGQSFQGEFPTGVDRTIQYGKQIQGLAT